MGVEIKVDDLTKSFGSQLIFADVSLTVTAGEICVMLGPSGTGKSVMLKTIIGLLKPDRGSVVIVGVDIASCPERELYEVRKLFGVLFQDGAMFGSMNLYDNVAFPLREHTKKSESEIRKIVMEKMDLVGLLGAEDKLPGEISGGMRKRAGLARALVLEPEIVLFDEPDSGLDPVRTAFLNQLIVDLNAQIDATFLIVTHDISVGRKTDRIVRAEAAQANGLENVGFFAAAVVAANVAGVSKLVLNSLSLAYLVSRALYNWLYVVGDKKSLALARTVVFFAGQGILFSLCILAGNRMR